MNETLRIALLIFFGSVWLVLMGTWIGNSIVNYIYKKKTEFMKNIVKALDETLNRGKNTV